MKLTRGLVVGSMLGMAAAMMINNQNTNSQSENNKNNTQSDNSKTHGDDIIITDIIR